MGSLRKRKGLSISMSQKGPHSLLLRTHVACRHTELGIMATGDSLKLRILKHILYVTVAMSYLVHFSTPLV